METGYLIPLEQENSRVRLPALFSLLWIFLSLNYILCDLLSNMEMAVLGDLLEGHIAGIPMTQGFLLLAGISLEIPFLMVVLSAVLPYRINRKMNIGAALLMILYQLGSFFAGSDSTLHYLFFSTIEVMGNIVILVLAIRWRK